MARIPVDQCIEILVRKDGTDTCRPMSRDTGEKGWDGYL